MRTSSAVAALVAALAAALPAVVPAAPAARILLDEREMTVRKTGTAAYRVHRIVRVEGRSGDVFAGASVPRGAFLRVKSIEGEVRDEAGKRIRKLDGDGIVKVDLSPSYVLAGDAGYSWFSLATNVYPYVAEYTCETELSTLLLWPTWAPQAEVPVDRAVYRVVGDADLEFRRHARGVPDEPTVRNEGRRTVWEWSADSLPAYEPPPGAPPEDAVPMLLRFAPKRFTVAGHGGDLDSWDGMARWYRSLAEGRDVLGPREADAVRAAVADAGSDRERVRRLYGLLQHHCRYVAVELGLGSWQPYSAESVYRNRYGDCKDLSTLMVAMLEVAGIRAYPALALTRDRGTVVSEFPSSQFNHCIAFVPLESDSIWLECTSTRHEAGDLPAAVEGCDVLVVTENAGNIVRTPESAPEDNLARTVVSGVLEDNGALSAGAVHEARGNAADGVRGSVREITEDGIRDWAAAALGRYTPGATVERVSAENLDGPWSEPVRIRAALAVPRFATMTGDRILLSPALARREDPPEALKLDGREVAVWMGSPRREVDSLAVRLPRGYHLAGAPDPVTVRNSVGQARIRYALDDAGVFHHVRDVRIERTVVEPERFGDLEELLRAVSASDAATFVFSRGRPDR